MKYDLANGSVSQEIMFHASHEKSLQYIKDQTEKPEVKITLNLLKGADKTKLLLMFSHDLELDKVLLTAQNFNKVLREVPINLLLQASDLLMVNAAIIKIFEQLKIIKNNDSYPKLRQTQLIEALCRDFTN